MNLKSIAFAGILSLSFAAPALATGPSPAKIAQGQISGITRATTVARGSKGVFGHARLELKGGRTEDVIVNMQTREVTSMKDLSSEADRDIALRAHRQGVPSGYTATAYGMTERGNPIVRIKNAGGKVLDELEVNNKAAFPKLYEVSGKLKTRNMPSQ
jgi:hypothetical protein